MIFPASIPESSGFSSYYANVGDMSNRGFELGLTLGIIETDKFYWDFTVNATTYKNEMKRMPELATAGDSRLSEGRSIHDFWLKKWYGVDPSDLGVIIRLDPDDSSPKARASVQEVYNQINSDLREAETLMDGISVPNNSNISLNTIKGMQARVALVQKKLCLCSSESKRSS